MPLATHLGALTTLQNAVNTAVNGTALDLVEAKTVLVEISGTFTNITANFEASLDGSTYGAVTLRNSAGSLVATATAVGLYRLEDARGLASFRARTTIGAVTGSMTIKAIAVV